MFVGEAHHSFDITVPTSESGHGISPNRSGVIALPAASIVGGYESCLDFQTTEKVDGNQGHTIVVPLKPLLSLRDQLSQDIWDFCDRPRSQSKIIGKFRRHGETAVLSSIKTLEKQKRLRPSNQGAHKLYQAV